MAHGAGVHDGIDAPWHGEPDTEPAVSVASSTQADEGISGGSADAGDGTRLLSPLVSNYDDTPAPNAGGEAAPLWQSPIVGGVSAKDPPRVEGLSDGSSVVSAPHCAWRGGPSSRFHGQLAICASCSDLHDTEGVRSKRIYRPRFGTSLGISRMVLFVLFYSFMRSFVYDRACK